MRTLLCWFGVHWWFHDYWVDIWDEDRYEGRQAWSMCERCHLIRLGKVVNVSEDTDSYNIHEGIGVWSPSKIIADIIRYNGMGHGGKARRAQENSSGSVG